MAQSQFDNLSAEDKAYAIAVRRARLKMESWEIYIGRIKSLTLDNENK